MMSDSSSDEGGELRYPKYTQEQKIVAGVWVHEKVFNQQTFNDIKDNFRIRFKMRPPKERTLIRWEQVLFSQGNLHRQSKRPPARLMHVPYVKASLREKPNLTLNERANQLGLSNKTLSAIIKYDLEDSDVSGRKDDCDQGLENQPQDTSPS